MQAHASSSTMTWDRAGAKSQLHTPSPSRLCGALPAGGACHCEPGTQRHSHVILLLRDGSRLRELSRRSAAEGEKPEAPETRERALGVTPRASSPRTFRDAGGELMLLPPLTGVDLRNQAGLEWADCSIARGGCHWGAKQGPQRASCEERRGGQTTWDTSRGSR